MLDQVADKPQLSVVLPAFNEEGNIAATLDRVERYLERACPEYEILVIDDGSRDGTVAVAGYWMRRNGRIRLLRHETNRGYGAALKTGFAAARGEWVFFMDADGQFEIDDLDRFLPLAREYDGVIGYRVRRRDPLLRRLNALGWNLLNRQLLGIPYRDIDCGFKLYHRRVLEAIPITSSGAMINAEMLARMTARGFRLAEVGVRHLPREAGAATGASPRVILRAFRELCSMHRQLRDEIRGRGLVPGRTPLRTP